MSSLLHISLSLIPESQRELFLGDRDIIKYNGFQGRELVFRTPDYQLEKGSLFEQISKRNRFCDDPTMIAVRDDHRLLDWILLCVPGNPLEN